MAESPIAMLTAIVLLTSVGQQGHTAPKKPAKTMTLCVVLQRDQQLARHRIQLGDLVTAIRARVGRRHLKVMPCEVRPRSLPIWRLRVYAVDQETIGWSVTGLDVRLAQRLPSKGLASEEITRFIALNAAEAVRPALDALLQRLGVVVEPIAATHSAVDTLELPGWVKRRTDAANKRSPEPPVGVAPGFALYSGLMVSVDAPVLSALLAARGALRWGSVALGAHFGIQLPTAGEHQDVIFSGWSMELALTISGHWRRFGVGLGALARITTVGLAGSSPDLGDDSGSYFNGGGQLELSYWPVLGNHLALGVMLSTRVWGWPRRFLVRSQPVWEQAPVEFVLGPVFGVRWSS